MIHFRPAILRSFFFIIPFLFFLIISIVNTFASTATVGISSSSSLNTFSAFCFVNFAALRLGYSATPRLMRSFLAALLTLICLQNGLFSPLFQWLLTQPRQNDLRALQFYSMKGHPTTLAMISCSLGQLKSRPNSSGSLFPRLSQSAGYSSLSP